MASMEEAGQGPTLANPDAHSTSVSHGVAEGPPAPLTWGSCCPQPHIMNQHFWKYISRIRRSEKNSPGASDKEPSLNHCGACQGTVRESSSVLHLTHARSAWSLTQACRLTTVRHSATCTSSGDSVTWETHTPVVPHLELPEPNRPTRMAMQVSESLAGFQRPIEMVPLSPEDKLKG